MAELPHVAWINQAIRQQGRSGCLVVNDSELSLNAVKAGIGKSLFPCLIADREPGLRRLGGPGSVLNRELWLLVNPSYKQVARIKAVTAWIEGIFGTRSL
jgi:DNA-binding transcriptional LysR family regulator